ncbi:MAG: penicillin-binding protein activator [Steroidobacteraceae bacterium]
MSSLPRHRPAPQPAAPPRLRRVAFALLAGAALLAGCSSLQEPGAGPASVDRAERLLRQNNPVAAAQMYERLAAANVPPDQVDFALAAVRAWLAATRPGDANRVLATVGTSLTPAQQFERALLGVEVLAAEGQNQAAWRQAAAIAEPRTPADAARLFHLRQQVALRAGLPVEAVRAGIARERVAATDAERAQIRRELLGDLRASIDRGQRVDPAASNEPLIRGWLEIAQIASGAGRSPLGAGAAIDRWRGRYPGHPASTIAMAEIVAPGNAGTIAPGRGGPLALLLPLTGRQSAAASLVRDGFQAGLAQLPPANRPELRVYDTGAMSVSAALQTALAEGAGLIAGPLTREEVQSAVELYSGTVPLLLLNNLASGSAGRGIYQYALSPEDEARAIARRALAAGQRRAIVFAPAGDWGNRVLAAFTQELTSGGGTVLSQGTYDAPRSDLTAMITRSLAVDASRARLRRVQQIVGGAELNFEARRRTDVDFILAAGQQSLALRQILPQLRFFGAGDVPTYVTADGMDTDPAANRDLEGALFTDMPWALDDSGPVADVRSSTQPLWAARGARLSRLFAFGYDAAALAVALSARQGPSGPIAGLTGRLSITADGRVERDLDWARISEGTSRRLDPLP